jgi:hypothetical protein
MMAKLAMVVSTTFERVSKLEVVAIPLHPKPDQNEKGAPKATHLQPHLVKVDAANNLLGRRGKGKSCKLRFADPVLASCERLRGIGLSLDEFGFPGATKRLDFLLSDRTRGGQFGTHTEKGSIH